jgi:hypothetical protein
MTKKKKKTTLVLRENEGVLVCVFCPCCYGLFWFGFFVLELSMVGGGHSDFF